jgi:hypothetical protein
MFALVDDQTHRAERVLKQLTYDELDKGEPTQSANHAMRWTLDCASVLFQHH